MSARYYEPTLHRWISRDPLDIAGGINLYTFNRNNPVNYVDPDGQLAFLPVLAAVIVVDFIYDRFFKDDVDRFIDCYVPRAFCFEGQFWRSRSRAAEG